MKKKVSSVLITVSMIVALSLGVATAVNAQKGKGVELGEAVVITAEVLAFDALKVGDSIHARLTKAIAISVEKP